MVIGVLGGAFNPPHVGHLEMARAALKRGIDRVLFLPSNQPPHKACDLVYAARRQMLALAIADEPRFEICDFEAENEGVHYSCETLPALKARIGEFTFILGGDSVRDMHLWKDPVRIANTCPLLAFVRGDGGEVRACAEAWMKSGARITLADEEITDISSSRVRLMNNFAAVENGDAEGVDPRVAAYIRAHGLYRDYEALVGAVREAVPDRTYAHIRRTCACALSVNENCRLKLDSDKVFLAALLHDAAKTLCKERVFAAVPADARDTAVAHQFAAAEWAQDAGIDDTDVLDAVRYHCTGKARMSVLGQLIYVADKIEPARDYAGVEDIRRVLARDFEAGFRLCMTHAIGYLKARGGAIYPLTAEAAGFYGIAF